MDGEDTVVWANEQAVNEAGLGAGVGICGV